MLEHDAVSHVDMVHILERKEGCILHASDEGIVLKHRVGTIFVAPFKEGFLTSLDLARGLYCIESESIPESILSRDPGFKEPTYLYVYDGEPFFLEGLDFKLMGLKDFPIFRHYYKTIEDDEVLRDYLLKGDVFALFDRGCMAGFIGFHSEGSMGMLEIFPEYRRKGYGEMAEKFIINEALKRGRAFCNVFFSNTASICLQEKLGLKRGFIPSSWIYID